MRFGILSRCFYLNIILFVPWCFLFKGIFCRFFLFIVRSISSWRLLSGQFQHIATTSALAPGKAIFETGILILNVREQHECAKFVFRAVFYPFCLFSAYCVIFLTFFFNRVVCTGVQLQRGFQLQFF